MNLRILSTNGQNGTIVGGDAAACPTPMAGMGTSIAIVGAYVLAGELQSTEDHGNAFARYEAIMRPFVTEAQKMAEGANWFTPETRMKLWFSKKMWSLMPQSTMRKLMIEQPARVARMVRMQEYSD